MAKATQRWNVLLAERFAAAGSSATGLVERRPDPAYARASLIFPTAHSAGFCRWPPPSSASLIGWRERPDPREVAELKAALTELVDLG